MSDTMRVDLEKLVADLRSGDLLLQGPAMEDAAKITKSLVTEATNALASTSSPYALASQIAMFGSVPHALEPLIVADIDDEVKVHVAALLLHFGSRSGVEFLLQMARSGKEPRLFVLQQLAKAGAPEARAYVEVIVRDWDYRADPYTGATVLDLLKKAGGTLPAGVRAKIRAEAYEPFQKCLLKIVEDYWGQE